MSKKGNKHKKNLNVRKKNHGKAIKLPQAKPEFTSGMRKACKSVFLAMKPLTDAMDTLTIIAEEEGRSAKSAKAFAEIVYESIYKMENHMMANGMAERKGPDGVPLPPRAQPEQEAAPEQDKPVDDVQEESANVQEESTDCPPDADCMEPDAAEEALLDELEKELDSVPEDHEDNIGYDPSKQHVNKNGEVKEGPAPDQAPRDRDVDERIEAGSEDQEDEIEKEVERRLQERMAEKELDDDRSEGNLA